MTRHQVNEHYTPLMKQRQLAPEHSSRDIASLDYRTAQPEHHELRHDSEGEGKKRHDDDRDARLRKDGSCIGNRQRFPKQNAPVAALSMQCVKAVKHRHQKSDGHNQHCDYVKRLVDDMVQFPRGQRRTQAPGKINYADHIAKQKQAGGGQWRDIEVTAFPNFALHQRVVLPKCGNLRRLDRLRSERRCRGVRSSVHCSAPCPRPCCLLITATNRSATPGVRTSPNSSSCCFSAPSNSRMVRPKTWRWWIGLRASAASRLSGCTITSK